MSNNRSHIFNAGPSVLPIEVLEEAQENLLNHKGAGLSVMEMSHRSKEFMAIIENAEANVRSLYNISDDYAVLFLQGGASMQFSMAPMNLASNDATVDLIQTGSWTKKATKEIKKVCKLNIAASSEDSNFSQLPDDFNFTENAAYTHICSNNTIAGTQFKTFPKSPSPLVADMSSDILSRELNINDFGMIFAGAQKNLGPSGVTLVIVKKELVNSPDVNLPSMLQYKTHIDANSLYNTPPTFGIYIIGLVTQWIIDKGGLAAIQKQNEEKAGKLYNAINNSGFYKCPVREQDRSLMNVVYRIMPDGKNGNEELEKKFITEAEAANLTGLKGHRSVGGLRASIYNACAPESVDALINFMEDFAKNNK